MSVYAYHLKAQGSLAFSGRCVRLRTLTGDEQDQYFETVAAQMGKDASQPAVINAYRVYCIKATVVGVTAPNSESCTKNDGWETVTFERAQLDFDKIFTTKDREMIGKVYSKFHDITTSEAEEIMGGAIPVEMG